jgi:hypothetical protein
LQIILKAIVLCLQMHLLILPTAVLQLQTLIVCQQLAIGRLQPRVLALRP